MPNATLPFDTTNCRRYFRRRIAQQERAMQQRMRHALEVTARRRPAPGYDQGAKQRPVPPAVVPGSVLLSATEAMAWLGLRPRPFYRWRNTLGIVPIVKKNHQALYLRQDLLRLHAASLAHTSAEETPHEG